MVKPHTFLLQKANLICPYWMKKLLVCTLGTDVLQTVNGKTPLVCGVTLANTQLQHYFANSHWTQLKYNKLVDYNSMYQYSMYRKTSRIQPRYRSVIVQNQKQSDFGMWEVSTVMLRQRRHCVSECSLVAVCSPLGPLHAAVRDYHIRHMDTCINTNITCTHTHIQGTLYIQSL